MNWYYVDNGQQAGPVDDAGLEALVASGKVKPDTLVWHEGMAAWTAYGQIVPTAVPPAGVPPVAGATPQISQPTGAGNVVCSECGRSFPPSEVIKYADKYACGNCKPLFFQRLREGGGAGAPGTTGMVTEADLLARDYEVDIGGCLSSGWELFRANAGGLIGANLLIWLVTWAISFGLMVIQGIIPIPLLTWPLGAMVSGPLRGGLWLFFLKSVRKQNPDIGQAFGGFGKRFWQLALTSLIPMLIFLAAVILIGIVTGTLALLPPLLRSLRGGGLNPPQLAAGAIFPLIGLGTVFLILWVYIGVSWIFALPLVADKGLKFWPALELSRRIVGKHWWMTFLLVAVLAVIKVIGMIACCVGVIVTVPLSFGMLNYHYQRVFGDLAPQG